MSIITNDGLTSYGTGCTHVATVSVKWLRSLSFFSFHSIDTEKNRLGLSLLEEDTGVPESVAKKFQKRLRNADDLNVVETTLAETASNKAVKRKADRDLVDETDDKTRVKRAKTERVKTVSNTVKEVSLY